MRFLVAVFLIVVSAVSPAAAQTVDREARVRFNASLPPNCAQGWQGRGIGVVAICTLADRVQVRFIDGRIAVCTAAGCADRAAEIDAFLSERGF